MSLESGEAMTIRYARIREACGAPVHLPKSAWNIEDGYCRCARISLFGDVEQAERDGEWRQCASNQAKLMLIGEFSPEHILGRVAELAVVDARECISQKGRMAGLAWCLATLAQHTNNSVAEAAHEVRVELLRLEKEASDGE